MRLRIRTPNFYLFKSLLIAVLLSLASLQTQQHITAQESWRAGGAGNIPAPEDVLGFSPGDDRKLASWSQVVRYFQVLDAASNRVNFAEIGKTTMGAPFVVATISSADNLARLDEFRNIQDQLADPRKLGANPDQKARELFARGKTIVLITCGIHSDEVGSYLSSMLIAHRLAASNEPEVQKILRDTIVLLVPSLNPDGVDIIKNWYDKTLGTPFEGTNPPQLYHKYTGHDDNRDWYAFTQVETQLTVDKIHNVWHPQIVHDIHQQGSTGARLFLPPYMDPVEPNVPKQIVDGYTELGKAIATDLRIKGFKGITTGTTYDAWSPSRAYSHYHGGVRILSETASCKIATPITVKFEDLRGAVGYDAKKETEKFFPLWQGGEWHLRDITNYMTTAAFSLMSHAAENREQWLSRFYEIGKEAVRERKKNEVFAFAIPSSMYAPKVLSILRRGGVEVITTRGFRKNGISYFNGTAIVLMNQPYGGFAKALLEVQKYPHIADDKGQPIAPYDVTAHTLSLLMGSDIKAVLSPIKYVVRPRIDDGVGEARNDCNDPSPVRVAIYRSFVPSMDEGWTRWIIDSKSPRVPPCLSYSSLVDKDVRAGNLRSKFSAILIPDQPPRAILEGHRKGAMPDEYTGGLGVEGVRALREFVEEGGTLVFLNRASDFAIEQFKLPVRDVTHGLKRTEFYAPGSILRVNLDTSHPLAQGMPKESISWVENSPVFEVMEIKAEGSPADSTMGVRVIARYPTDKDPLLSGWLLGGDRMKGKAALVEVTLGKGRIILFGFRPQYRAQSLATYPLLFNALKPQMSASKN